MANGAHAADKNEAWRQGRDANVTEETFLEVWMVDKYALPHGQKLQTVFYDARHNTQTLARYNAAELRITAINMAPVPKSRTGFMSTARWTRLGELVRRTNVQLPDRADITAGPALFIPRAVGQAKDTRLKEQRTYRMILEKVADLMEFVATIYETGIANVANRQDAHVLEMRGLENVEFLKCMRGYPAGICHAVMHGNLEAKVNLVMHDD